MRCLIEAKNLHFEINGKVILSNINLTLAGDEVVTIIGPNGAGKSSTIGIIGSLITKTDGKVTIFGIDIDENFPEAKRMLGVVSQEINFNNFEKVGQFCHFGT